MKRTGRRDFLLRAGVAGLGIAGLRGVSAAEQEARPAEAGVPATEELMVEHAVVRRLLLVFDECADRLTRNEALPAGALLNAGAIVDSFVEAYHEELEEKHVFPLLEKLETVKLLVPVLRRQHAAGRAVAPRIMFIAGRGPEQLDDGMRRALAALCRVYTRMYRAHAAHEDIVFSGALREILSPQEFATLGERFQGIGTEILGTEGLSGVLKDLTAVEEKLGIAGLDHWTAQAPSSTTD
jgi:hemerythrin-like domain-containing protein